MQLLDASLYNGGQKFHLRPYLIGKEKCILFIFFITCTLKYLEPRNQVQLLAYSLSYLIHENCCSIDEGEGKKFYVFLGITILGLTYLLMSVLKGGGCLRDLK
jgi:hypothetical protein